MFQSDFLFSFMEKPEINNNNNNNNINFSYCNLIVLLSYSRIDGFVYF